MYKIISFICIFLFILSTSAFAIGGGGGNASGPAGPAGPPGPGGTPGGSVGQIQYNGSGAFAGFTLIGDCSLVPSTGTITCTKTSNTPFGSLATAGIGTGLTLLSSNLTLSNSGVSAGTYTLMTGTVDQYGRITVASNGSIVVLNYFPIGAGNASYGNSSQFSNGNTLINEIFPLNGILDHISCANINGGNCITPPTFRGFVIHNGSPTFGAILTCNAGQDALGQTNSVLQNLSWIGGDTIGIQLVTIGANCNNPRFDIDILAHTIQTIS